MRIDVGVGQQTYFDTIHWKHDSMFCDSSLHFKQKTDRTRAGNWVGRVVGWEKEVYPLVKFLCVSVAKTKGLTSAPAIMLTYYRTKNEILSAFFCLIFSDTISCDVHQDLHLAKDLHTRFRQQAP